MDKLEIWYLTEYTCSAVLILTVTFMLTKTKNKYKLVTSLFVFLIISNLATLLLPITYKKKITYLHNKIEKNPQNVENI